MVLKIMMPDVARKKAHLEGFAPDPVESFRWRMHDYPCTITCWNQDPEYEIHLIRKSTGKAFVGDYIGEFGPGCLMAVGSNLPHNWVNDLEPGRVVRDRDIVLQFDTTLFTRAVTSFPEVTEVVPFLTTWHRGFQFHDETASQGAMLMEQIGQARGFHRLVLFLELVRCLAQS